MLGSRRATVTLSAGLLQAAGLIRYRRGRVTIVDRQGLEGVFCECYATIKTALDAVVATPRLDEPRSLCLNASVASPLQDR
jgi:Crp-like helix-turn-helix domain